jgi:ornithine carbamoyltransferase
LRPGSLSTMSILISRCKDFEGSIEQTAEQQKDVTGAAVIIHDRLVSLRDSMEACERNMSAGQLYLQVYRHWVIALPKSHLVNVG